GQLPGPVPVSRRSAGFARCAFRLGDRPLCGAGLCAVRPPGPFLRPDGTPQRRPPAVINGRRPAVKRACFFHVPSPDNKKGGISAAISYRSPTLSGPSTAEKGSGSHKACLPCLCV